MKLSLSSKPLKEYKILKIHPSLNEKEAHATLFLAMVVFHIFKRTGAIKGLSDKEISSHISRVVFKSRKGITVAAENVPHIRKAKSLAKAVIEELQKKYGDQLKYMLLEPDAVVEAFVVRCLKKHIKRQFQQRSQWNDDTKERFPFLLLLLSFAGYFLMLIGLTMGIIIFTL
ncbi:hypothetical protein JOB18_048656 [Solea senegalensis]|uniref:Uncharacterized protein n=1 Tax=Solea senegalensis TaxID=28829 RepID=A0AAV6RPE9_SOLSE|nr:hypothetical protein JOB18_048656 [Solea senegalensis]